MAGSHYSSQELFILRNHIPIESLIKELEMPWKIIEGYFRFCCPVCEKFNSGVNSKTNLARCFGCEKNYNTIDLVMHITRSNFIQSVKFLKKFHIHKDKSRILYHPPNRRTASIPVSIGEVLKSIGTQSNNSRKVTSKISKITKTAPSNDIYERVRQLEQKVESLSQKINLMENNS